MSLNAHIGLLRRLASIFYDGLLLFSLLFVCSFFVLPFTGGEAIPSDNWVYPLILLAACFFFFTWQWVKGGQTLGMRAWQCRLVQQDKQNVSWSAASSRFFLAIVSWAVLGAGYWMAWFRSDRKTFHDLYSHTYLIRVSKD